jgi:hypothetical protein
MKRSIQLMSMFAAMVLSGPAAMAGDIVKCVDADGRVTLTDQPCSTGAAAVRLDQERTGPRYQSDFETPFRSQFQGDRQRHVLPAADLRQWRRPDLSRAAPLTLDVATLKAAHRTLMLQDARPTLAGLP